jgi:hypothetical protein
MRRTVVCVEQDGWIRHGPGPGFCGGGAGQAKGSAVQYETVAEAFRDWSGPVAGWRFDRLAAPLARITGIASQPFWLYQRARAASASSGSEQLT